MEVGSPEEVQLRVGRVLRDLRRERGIPQDKIEDLPQQYVSMIERGKQNPSWLSILRILTSLDVSVEEFGRRWDRESRADASVR